MIDLTLELALFLAVAAFAAGFIDAIAGGGGLITVPALVLAGFDPVAALGTNKLQSLFGSGSATLVYAAKGHVELKSQWKPAAFSFAGAVLGAALATITPAWVLKALLPVLLIAIALYFAFKPALTDTDRSQRISPFLFSLTVVPLIGFYDGVFGPGTGSFFMLAYVAPGGYGVLRATAHTKVMNFASNFGGFVAFAAFGVVAWKAGLLMGASQFAGARIGAQFAMKNGARIIKPLLVVTCTGLAIRLLMDETNPLRQLIAG